MRHMLDSIINRLDSSKRLTSNGGEYWMARDIQKLFGYDTWESFDKTIKRAYMACESAGVDPNNQFREVTNMVEAGSGTMVSKKDYYLSRYACYLMAMNGDSRKPEIGIAQTYFAVQTRKQEFQQQIAEEERRILLRDRIKDANRSLISVAKEAGVQKYALFHDYGYRGLYEMGLSDIKRFKGIPDNENLLDRIGRAELAANEFRITQTEEKIRRDGIKGEKQAMETHHTVGQEVRATIKKIGGAMPEHLPIAPPITKLISTHRKVLKGKGEKKNLSQK